MIESLDDTLLASEDLLHLMTRGITVSHIRGDQPPAVLLKGGHIAGERVVDVLLTTESEALFEGPRIETRHTHGTGCTLSTGTLDGKQGTFTLQHFATMDASGSHMQVQIVPGSGTGQLQGITGTFTINIVGKQHNYELTYELPH